MVPVTCSLAEPVLDVFNTLLAFMTQVLGPLGLSTVLNPISNALGWLRALAGCP